MTTFKPILHMAIANKQMSTPRLFGFLDKRITDKRGKEKNGTFWVLKYSGHTLSTKAYGKPWLRTTRKDVGLPELY